MGKRFYYTTLLENFPATLGETASMALTPHALLFQEPTSLGVFQQRGPLSPTSLRNVQRRLSERFRPQIGCRQVEWETPPMFWKWASPWQAFFNRLRGGIVLWEFGSPGIEIGRFSMS